MSGTLATSFVDYLMKCMKLLLRKLYTEVGHSETLHVIFLDEFQPAMTTDESKQLDKRDTLLLVYAKIILNSSSTPKAPTMLFM